MPEENQRLSICPIEDCEYAEEFDPASAAFCPECGMELLSDCPDCHAPITEANQASCRACGRGFKE